MDRCGGDLDQVPAPRREAGDPGQQHIGRDLLPAPGRAEHGAAGDQRRAAGSRSGRPTRPTASATQTLGEGAKTEETKGFIGEREDPEVGLVYLNARYYDPDDRAVYFAGLVGSDGAGRRDQPVCVLGE